MCLMAYCALSKPEPIDGYRRVGDEAERDNGHLKEGSVENKLDEALERTSRKP